METRFLRPILPSSLYGLRVLLDAFLNRDAFGLSIHSRRAPRIGAIQTALFAMVVVIVGCGQDPTTALPKTPTHYRVFVDLSKSVSDQQKARWPEEAKRLARRLAYGDAVTLYPMHTRTTDSAPLFHATIPVFPEDGTRSEQGIAKAELHRVRHETLRTLQAAIHPTQNTPVRATDVFGAFDQFRPDPLRTSVVLILSDGLESADSRLNLERTCLGPLDPSAIIPTLAERRRWHNRTLAGARVVFLLPAVDSNDAQHCNDTGQLRRFYSLLIGALGGELVDFNPVWNTTD